MDAKKFNDILAWLSSGGMNNMSITDQLRVVAIMSELCEKVEPIYKKYNPDKDQADLIRMLDFLDIEEDEE